MGRSSGLFGRLTFCNLYQWVNQTLNVLKILLKFFDSGLDNGAEKCYTNQILGGLALNALRIACVQL